MSVIKTSITLVLLAGMLAGTACKYEDGPLISFRSKKERVVNTWELEKYYRNGNDETSKLLISDFTETYTDDGKLSRSFTEEDGDHRSQTGTWEFDENEEVIDIDGLSSIELTDETSTVSTSQIIILKLKENKFWYSFENGGDEHEFHLISKN